MISIGILLSLVAVGVALVKRGRLWKQVLVFVALSVLTFLITNWYVNSCSENFCGIGQALIGSLISMVFSLAAVFCAFQPKRLK